MSIVLNVNSAEGRHTASKQFEYSFPDIKNGTTKSAVCSLEKNNITVKMFMAAQINPVSKVSRMAREIRVLVRRPTVDCLAFQRYRKIEPVIRT